MGLRLEEPAPLALHQHPPTHPPFLVVCVGSLQYAGILLIARLIRFLLRVVQDWTQDGSYNLLPYRQAGHEIKKKWLVRFKQYKRPIHF